MHSLALLVGGSFPPLWGPKKRKKKFLKIFEIFQVPQLFARECWNAETPYLGPNGFAGNKTGQGRSLGEYIFEKMAKISWTVRKMKPPRSGKTLYLPEFESD